MTRFYFWDEQQKEHVELRVFHFLSLVRQEIDSNIKAKVADNGLGSDVQIREAAGNSIDTWLDKMSEKKTLPNISGDYRKEIFDK